MSMTFDLISDLHLETWPGEFDWTGQPTSPVCVVAGDISSDPRIVRNCLKHLANCYAAVFYIDGNDEHTYNYHRLGESYQELARSINRLNRRQCGCDRWCGHIRNQWMVGIRSR